jgi:hypothetical protein
MAPARFDTPISCLDELWPKSGREKATSEFEALKVSAREPSGDTHAFKGDFRANVVGSTANRCKQRWLCLVLCPFAA